MAGLSEPPSDPAHTVAAAPARWWRIDSWQIRDLPARALTSVLIIEATAVALTIGIDSAGPSAASAPVQALWRAGLLMVAGLMHVEIAFGIERTRSRLREANHVDLSSVWTFAAALLLPPALAAALVVVLQIHRWLRVGRPRAPLYRAVFSTATIVLACLGASAVITYGQAPGPGPDLTGPRLLTVLLALAVYTTINSCLIAAAIAMSSPKLDLNGIFGGWDDNALEIATLCLGGLTACAIVLDPWLLLFVPVPLLLLHRAVLVRQLEEAANTDGKTGLLTAAAWQMQAQRLLRRTGRAARDRAVLVLDLDHFKGVNDTHGHLAGDHVLSAVGAVLRAEVRDRDLVGRFGGEEFVVLLADLDDTEGLAAVAERIRARIAELRVEIPTPDGPLSIAGLSVSIGAAACANAEEGDNLDHVLHFADTALYDAKRGGRNTIRISRCEVARAVPVPEQRVGGTRNT